MLGLMQEWPLTLDKILDYAKENHGGREIVTRSVEGPMERTTYAEVHARAKQASNALKELGVGPGDRVATMAWNTARHMEVWYGAVGIGAIYHTLNPRLHPEQICWIINHAQDRVVFTDLTFAPLLLANIHRAPSVERIVILTDAPHRPADIPGSVLTYEELIGGQSAECAWGGFDENTAAGLCYTSGTTGDPKGVLYSHRSNFLHTFICLQSDVMGIGQKDTVLPITPMFHANAWGMVFNAPAAGSKLVMCGAKLDGPSVHELLETEGVTMSCAVPTVWQMLLQHLEASGGRLTTLKRVLVGGSAVPEAMIRAFHDRYGVEVVHAWGMTEMSPLGTVGSPTAEVAELPFDQQVPWRVKQGRAFLGVELKLIDEAGRRLPRDGRAFGHLKVRGPAVARRYYRDHADILDGEGYFDTGDVATIDPEGFMQVTDRAKDMIKSGGEWISSIDVENAAVGHPKAALAAVVGVPHPKWQERPLLLIKLKPGETATEQEFLDFLIGKLAKWWLPDQVRFVDEIPLGATGKVDKKAIRAGLAGYRLAEAAGSA